MIATLDNAHKVLNVYNHFKSEPGTALISNHFLGVGRIRLWSAADLQKGLDEAVRRGWVEKAERGWRLTDSGFSEASKTAAATTD